MAKVKEEHKILSPKGSVYVLWYCDDVEGYGVEVIGEDGVGGATVGLNDWSFGHTDEARELSRQWLEYVTHRIVDNNAEVPDEIDEIELYWNGVEPELQRQNDLPKIKELLKVS